jgi:hypothetical protein
MIYFIAALCRGPFMPDPIALRVARRHAREAAVVFRDVPAPKRRIELSSSGRISAAYLTRTLEPTCGPVTKLVFHRTSAHEIGWAAVDPAGGVVSGALTFHVALGEHEVASWAEVTVDPAGSSIVIDPSALALVGPERTTSAAERVAREYARRREGLVPADGEEQVGDDGESGSSRSTWPRFAQANAPDLSG